MRLKKRSTLQEMLLLASRTLRRAGKIVADPSHPGHTLFEVLPSGTRLWSIRTKTSRHKTSFCLAAVGLSNTHYIAHCTLHIHFCTPALLFVLNCSTYCVCVVLTVFLCLMLCVVLTVFLCFMLCVVLTVFVCFYV